MKTTKVYGMILCLVMTAAGAYNAPAQETLTVDRAVELALRQNNSLRAASSALEASTWNSRQAYTNFLPRVELSGSLTRIDNESEARANAAVDFIRAAAGSLGLPPSLLADLRPFAYRETYATDITVVQPIYNGGMELAGVKAAGARRDHSEQSFREAEQALIAGVRIAYYSVLKDRALLSVAGESADRTRRWLEMMERREVLGQRTPTDVLRFRVQLAQEEGNVVLAGNRLASSRLLLNDLMGEPLDAVYVPEEIVPLDLDSGSVPLPGPGILPGEDTVLADHPSLLAAEAGVRLAEAGVSQAWTRFQPRVNLAFQYGWERNNTIGLDGIRPWALALTVNWPIFNGFGDYANLRKTEAEAAAVREQSESYRRGIRIGAEEAALSLEAARKRVEIAATGLREAGRVLESMSRRYDLGSASNVDLIDAQTANTQARTAYVTAVYDTFITTALLERARGAVRR